MYVKIIITGVHGYISNSIRKHFIETHKFNGGVQLLDLRNDNWLEEDFSQVDTIIHCAALVHKDPNRYSLDDYIEVNTNFTQKIAKKAKREGVKYFIFFSTEGVYGTSGSLFNDVILDKNTELNPIEKYEISKKMAEDRLMELEDDHFRIAIIRPPFVYGKDCPGNYNRLRKAVLTFRFIPLIQNRKSMIYIENLCEFIYQLWVRKLDGIFLPQDLPYRCTSDMCKRIAKYHNLATFNTVIFNPIIKLASLGIRAIRVSFGSEYYSEVSSELGFKYDLIDFDESIKRTEL